MIIHIHAGLSPSCGKLTLKPAVGSTYGDLLHEAGRTSKSIDRGCAEGDETGGVDCTIPHRTARSHLEASFRQYKWQLALMHFT